MYSRLPELEAHPTITTARATIKTKSIFFMAPH